MSARTHGRLLGRLRVLLEARLGARVEDSLDDGRRPEERDEPERCLEGEGR
jgi:hypothetical protein